jgi:hypothetical protein
MMKRIVLLFSLALTSVVTTLNPNNGFAYSIGTHEGITDRSVNIIEANLDIYLQRNLTLSLMTNIKDLSTGQTKSALGWITTGSAFEDGESILDITQPRKHFDSRPGRT